MKERVAKSRLAFADIPEQFKDLTIKSFDTTLYKTENGKHEALTAKKICGNYVKNFEKMKEDGKGLYLYSEVKGSGKTRMAVSIANALINHKNTSAKFTTALKILEEIKNTYGKDAEYSESKLLEQISRVDVIVFDDIGTEKASSWVNEKFYEILNNRLIDKKVTMFTSNCKVEELKLDERIKNRIQRMAIPVKFPEESIRGYLAQKENEEAIEMLLR